MYCIQFCWCWCCCYQACHYQLGQSASNIISFSALPPSAKPTSLLWMAYSLVCSYVYYIRFHWCWCCCYQVCHYQLSRRWLLQWVREEGGEGEGGRRGKGERKCTATVTAVSSVIVRAAKTSGNRGRKRLRKSLEEKVHSYKHKHLNFKLENTS